MPQTTVRRRHSLAGYLAALKVIAAVPLLALAVIPISIYIAGERERLDSIARTAREEVLSLVDRDLATKIAILRVFATGRTLEENDLDRFDEVARQVVGNEPFNIVLQDASGRQLVNTAVPKGTPLPTTANPALEGKGLSETYITGLIWGRVIKQRATTVIVPVVRDGRLRYRVMAVLSSQYFVRLLSEHGPRAPYYAIIADQEGTIIASSSHNEEFFGKTIQIARTITTVEGRWSGTNSAGVPVVGVHSRSPLSGWIVAVAVPQTALSAPLRQSILFVLGLIAVIAAGAVGVGFLLSRKLTQIFRSLSAAARSLGDGEQVSVAPSSLREANEIGAALQQASRKLSEHADQLRRANQDLEHRVNDRTRELRSAAEAYRSIVDNAKDAIVVGDGEGKITFFNKAAESIFGYSAGEAVGRNVAVLMPELQLSARDIYVENHCASRQRGANSWQMPVCGCHKDGSRIALDLALAEWRDGDGRPHFTGILRDVRERERQAAELRAAKESAEAARARAEAASDAKSQFLASMSHEIRTPLGAISGFAQLIHSFGGSLMRDRQMRYTQSIMDASEQLESIINDVLDMARVEAGMVELNCKPLDCLELMTEVYRTIELSAQRRGITFTCDTSGTLPPVSGDQKRLTQVLLNLASNAVKYNSEGGWVVFTATPRHGSVRFLMRDTGRGIAPEQHERVFRPFSRLDAEKGPEGGAGLGLAISQRLVHAMNGEIGFESKPGVGSTFWVDIPVATDDIATKSAAPAARLDAAGDAALTILYIEDRKTNIELMQGIVEGMENIRCVDAQTVEDGVALAKTLRFDIVITDIHLPDGTGFDVLQSLRADPQTQHVPVVALTADAMPTNMENMARHGFDHILTKPFKIADLMEVISATAKAA